MANLTADRNTMAKTQGVFNTFPVKGTTTIYAGALVCTDTSGLAVPAVNTASFRCQGRANVRADNAAGADRAIGITVQEGVYKWDNAASTDAVTNAEIGKPVYVFDDHTVSKTAGNAVIAGIALQIDADGGVWVKTMPSGGI